MGAGCRCAPPVFSARTAMAGARAPSLRATCPQRSAPRWEGQGWGQQQACLPGGGWREGGGGGGGSRCSERAGRRESNVGAFVSTSLIEWVARALAQPALLCSLSFKRCGPPLQGDRSCASGTEYCLRGLLYPCPAGYICRGKWPCIKRAP
jgi:hypothetical protein